MQETSRVECKENTMTMEEVQCKQTMNNSMESNSALQNKKTIEEAMSDIASPPSTDSNITSGQISRDSSLHELSSCTITPSSTFEGLSLIPAEKPQTQPPKKQVEYYKIFLSIIYCMTFVAYGSGAAALNWSTEVLANLTGTTITEIGWVFTVKNFGYTLGTGLYFQKCVFTKLGLSGKFYSMTRVKKGETVGWFRFTSHKLFVLSQLFLAAMIALVPIFPNFAVLITVNFFVGLACGFMETGGCSFLVLIWKKSADPWLSLIQFSYGLGSSISPLIANLILTEDKYSFREVRICYWIISCLCVLSCIPFPFLSTPAVEEEKDKKHEIPKEDAPKRKWYEFYKTPNWWKLSKASWITLLCGTYVLFSTGALLSYTGLIFQYATMKNMDVKASTAIASVTWGAITAVRLIMTPVAMFVDNKTIITIGLFGCYIALIEMLIFRNQLSLWIGTIMYGIFLSPQYPSVIGFPSSVGVTLSSTMTGFIISFSAVGSMALPVIITSLFGILGPESIFWMTLAATFGSTITFIIMVSAFRKKRNPDDPPRKWYLFWLKERKSSTNSYEKEMKIIESPKL